MTGAGFRKGLPNPWNVGWNTCDGTWGVQAAPGVKAPGRIDGRTRSQAAIPRKAQALRGLVCLGEA